MTPTVLVPLDGSDKDQRVIPAAAAFARLADGDLHLVRVLGLPAESLSPRARTMGTADAASVLRREMQQSVQIIADRLSTFTDRSVTAEVAEDFDVAEVLIDSAIRRDADLVVMATRAPGAVSRALLGSVADRVVRESSRPVVLVPPGVDRDLEESLQLHRVLVALDGSPLASAAIDQLLALKRGRELEFVLLEVVTVIAHPPVAPDPSALQPYVAFPDPAEARRHAERRLSGVADRLRSEGARNVRVRVVDDAHPAAAIAHVAREERADFIGMSTRGMSGVKRFVLGSVAEAVVRDSDLPVLLVRPRDR